MALDLAPSNFAGLAALASGGSGNLNLTVPGALGLQGLQIGNQNAASVRDAAIQQMQIRQQAETALRQQQIARQELAQQGQYQQGLLGQAARGQDIQQQGQMLDADQNAAQLGFQQQQLAQQGALGQGQLDVEKQKLAQDQMAKEMAKLLDEKKEKLQEKGAYVATSLMAIKQAKTPEEAQMIRNEIVNTAESNEYITKEMARALKKAPLSQFTNFLTQQAMTLDAVKNYKEMMDADKKQSDGYSKVVMPDGTVVETMSPTKAVETEVMKDIKTKDLATQQLQMLEKDFKPEYFTDKSQLDAWISGQAERKKGLPLLEQTTEFLANTLTGKAPKQREAFISERKSYFNKVDQMYNTYKKEITGQAAGEKELEQIKNSFINGEMSPSEFKGALEQVVTKYKSETEYNKSILNNGINTSPDDAGMRQFFKQNGKSDAEIDAWFKSRRQ